MIYHHSDQPLPVHVWKSPFHDMAVSPPILDTRPMCSPLHRPLHHQLGFSLRASIDSVWMASVTQLPVSAICQLTIEALPDQKWDGCQCLSATPTSAWNSPLHLHTSVHPLPSPNTSFNSWPHLLCLNPLWGSLRTSSGRPPVHCHRCRHLTTHWKCNYRDSQMPLGM